MATKPKPRFGWEPKGWRIEDVSDLYPPEFLDAIARDHGIPPDPAIDGLSKALAVATSHYRRFEHNRKTRPKPSEVRAALAEIEGLARDLLDRMDGHICGYLWEVASDVEVDLMRGKKTILDDIGAISRGTSDDDTIATYYAWDDVQPVLRMLAAYSQQAQENLPAGRRGRQPRIGLRHWVGRLCTYWEDELGRRVTHQSHRGEGLTPIYQFLVDLMKPLDPDAIPHIDTVLADERTRRSRLRKIGG